MRNPYYPRQTRKRSRFGRFLWWTIPFVFLIGISYLFISPFFAIQTITVTGATSMSKETVQNAVRTHIPTWMRLPFLRKTIELALEVRTQLNLASVVISKQYPHTLRIEIGEYVPVALWQVGADTIVIDQRGTTLRSATSDDLANMHFTRFVGESPPFDTSAVFPLSETNRMLALSIRDAISKSIGVSVTTLKIPATTATWMKFGTTEGWDVYVDLTIDVNAQLIKLAPVLTNIGPVARKKLSYIDVRFGDRAYYK